jgi:hypothetical protein
MGGVEDDAGDVDEAGVVEPVQHGFVQATPDTGSRPDQKPAVSRRLRYAETGRQLTPGASADQDVQWVSDLTAPQTNEFRQTLDAMLRERSGGRPVAVLHTELTVGTRRRP